MSHPGANSTSVSGTIETLKEEIASLRSGKLDILCNTQVVPQTVSVAADYNFKNICWYSDG